MSDLRRYETVSRSQPGKRHELVTTADGRVLSCACAAWSFRHECRHAARLAAFLAEFRETLRWRNGPPQ